MGMVIVEGEGAVLGVNLGRPIVTNKDFATRLFPNYFGQDLLLKWPVTKYYIKCLEENVTHDNGDTAND